MNPAATIGQPDLLSPFRVEDVDGDEYNALCEAQARGEIRILTIENNHGKKRDGVWRVSYRLMNEANRL